MLTILLLLCASWLPEPGGARASRYALDSATSTLTVQTRSAGLLSAFGHDHRIAARRLSGTCEADPAAWEKTRVEIRVESASLAVVDRKSKDDAAEIDKEMRSNVL